VSVSAEATKISQQQSSKSRGSRWKSGGHGTGSSSSSITSFQKGVAHWTKKVSGSIPICGATLSHQPSEEEEQPILDSKSMSSSSSHNNKYNNNNNSNNNMERPTPERPPRKQKKHDDCYDSDNHTLPTASTSATAASSTDQGDELYTTSEGMEVIMSSHSHELNMSGVLQDGPHVSYQSHSFQAGKHTFTVDRNYSLIRVIGSGAYGVVISASDAKTVTNVAIKMVPKAFSDEIDAKRILREIKLLKHFRHENIVRLIDMMPPNVEYLEDFNDVYLVADLMETDLHRIIYSKQKLSTDHVQYFIYQVLRGLKYIHSCKVLHRDLKPSNLLVNSNCDLKICDFGLARGIDLASEQAATAKTGTMLLTEYVVTRWYRAPEIMLACHEYSYPIDVWSVGCIFAELILRKPLFPGDDYIDQVR
jgi:tRNA A-37 threonylcarbamoyl transferase component Bud32